MNRRPPYEFGRKKAQSFTTLYGTAYYQQPTAPPVPTPIPRPIREDPIEEYQPPPKKKRDYRPALMAIISAFFALYQLGQLSFGFNLAAMLAEHAILHRIVPSAMTSFMVMMLAYFSSSQFLAMAVAGSLMLFAWMGEAPPKELYEYFPLWVLLTVATVHVYYLNPQIHRITALILEKGMEVGWFVMIAGSAVAAVVAALPWMPTVLAWIMKASIWAVKKWVSGVDHVVIMLDEVRQIHHKTTQTEKCTLVSVAVQTDDVGYVKDNGEHEVIQLFMRQFQYRKVHDAQKELRTVMKDVVSAADPEELIIACMRGTPTQVNTLLYDAVVASVTEHNHNNPLKMLRNIAHLVEVDGYQDMSKEVLVKQIYRNTHPDKNGDRSECEKKAYEVLFKVSRELSKIH